MNEIFHRTSIRKYESRPVGQEKIELLLKAAMAAPSAGNQQPWEYYVVTDPDKLSGLSECSPFARCAQNAPLAFVACARTAVRSPEYADIDMSASVENLLLEADSLGLGAVWIGIAPLEERMDKVAKVLELPDRLRAFAIIPCGYPAEERIQQNRYDETRVHYIGERK